VSIELEPWGGVVVRWAAIDLSMLVDWASGEVWVVLTGKPIVVYQIAEC